MDTSRFHLRDSSHYHMAQYRWHTGPVQRKQTTACLLRAGAFRTRATFPSQGEATCRLGAQLAALCNVMTHLNAESEGRNVTDHFPNMDPLTSNCDCADLIALGKILSFLHSS